MSAPVMTVEEMLERLRREAEVRGPGWLQEQVGACIISPAPVATPNVRAARPRRSIPPARLSPEVSPRARRRVGSPPVDPQRRRAAAQPSASRSRRGRNPVTRRGPVRSGTPLPPLPAAVQLDSGPGTVDRPSPSFSGRSTRLFDDVRVPRTALVEDEYQRRSREDLSSVEEGPLAVVEAAVSSQCPASVVQRVVQVVQEEQPSTSRSYDGAVSVRQESGSAAAGVTAPVVPGRMMAALVWILGHSYVFWGAIRVDVRQSGRQLGVSPELATVRWLGVRGVPVPSVRRRPSTKDMVVAVVSALEEEEEGEHAGPSQHADAPPPPDVVEMVKVEAEEAGLSATHMRRLQCGSRAYKSYSTINTSTRLALSAAAQA
ncbi:EZH inhibitory protein-like [Bufo bufo]|uniref:EZH inhibitory protein-like n=1 Tax=Bufo bufo TaxID=8384 RepID=UPI001ABDDF8B|nr:EZH inhibitory protein-like [Bufo bufo]